jgi:hypothetical protein
LGNWIPYVGALEMLTKLLKMAKCMLCHFEHLYKIWKEIKGFKSFPYNFKTHVAKNDENYVEGSKQGGNLK